MTTPTPGDLSARHVEVLRRMRSDLSIRLEGMDRPDFARHEAVEEASALDYAIAALSALPAAGGGDEVARVAAHIRMSVEYIEKVYPGTRTLDAAPILRNMRRWAARLESTTPQPSAADDYESWAKQERQREDTATRLGAAAVGAQGDVSEETIKRAMDAMLPNGHRVWAYIAGGNPDPSVSGREVMRAALEAVHAAGNYRDAYEGAREDLLDWKGRALRAESQLRALGWQGIDASEAPSPAKEGAECETCGGLGWIDETLGGYSFANPKAPCPDCDGRGEVSLTPNHLSAAPAAGKGVDDASREDS